MMCILKKYQEKTSSLIYIHPPGPGCCVKSRALRMNVCRPPPSGVNVNCSYSDWGGWRAEARRRRRWKSAAIGGRDARIVKWWPFHQPSAFSQIPEIKITKTDKLGLVREKRETFSLISPLSWNPPFLLTVAGNNTVGETRTVMVMLSADGECQAG